MPKWTEYTSKDTLADNDEVMLYDATGKANKRGLMSKFWNYVVDKMSTAVISKLETENKTVIGALNYLNGKTNIISYPIRSKLDFITVSGNFLCIGNIVIYHFTIKSTKDWSDQSVPIFKDVPVPIVNDTCLSGMAYTGNGVYKTSFRLYSGILYLNESLSANVPYIVTGSYIKNN